MKKVNLVFGLVLFGVFLASGFYMKNVFKPQHINDLVLRMEIRANHIYIAFISFLNLLAFKSELSIRGMFSKVLDFVFRGLLIASGVVAVYAFLYNHHGNLLGRGWTLLSIVLSLSAVALALIHELIQYATQKD